MFENFIVKTVEYVSELKKGRDNSKKNINYLCVTLINILEKYSDNCVEVVGDDGLYHGQTDENGYHLAQVDLPEPPINSKNEDLKLLPNNLMQRLIYLSREIEIANNKIAGKSEHASIPDFPEAFEERQYQYAILAFKARSFVKELREICGMPLQEKDEWDKNEYLKDKLYEIEKIRRMRDAEHAKLWSTFVPNTTFDNS